MSKRVGCWSDLGSAVLALFLALATPTPAGACPGDCSGDLRVTVDELVKCVHLGLGRNDLAACAGCDADRDGAIAIEELVASVRVALQSVIVMAGGTCLRPGAGANGLEPCAAGTEVSFSRCQDRSRCLSDAGGRTMLDAAPVGENGSFSLATCDAVGATLIFEAEVSPATTYRVLSFGPVGSGAGVGTGTVALADVSIDPRSEAGIRVLEDNGLQNFNDEGIVEILAAVDESTAALDFSNLDADEAADVATSTAAKSDAVQSVIESNRITPTPTPTGTPTSTATFTPTRAPAQVNVTGEGAVEASSVFPNGLFPVTLAVDDDRTTSWFSDGEAGGPIETFRWTGARDDRIASIAILSNAQHPEAPGFGFGSVRIEVRDAGDGVVFGETRDLPGDTDPDVMVLPNVLGRSVLLTFTGHDDPTCGGFSELVITALR